MAKVHNQISRGELTSMLTRALGVTTPETGLERYGETIGPVIDPWSLAEWRYLRREASAGDATQVAGGAATTLASYALVNPAGSRIIVVVENLSISLPVAAEVRVGIDTEVAIAAQLGTIRIGTFKDTRWSATAVGPVARIRTGATAIALGSRIDLSNRTVTISDCPAANGVVLTPGFGLVVQNQDDTAVIDCSIQWRERQAYPNELV